MREILLRLGISILALLCLAATHAHACGPDFPNNLLDSGDRGILAAPTLRFGDELERMHLTQTRWRAVFTTNDFPQQSRDAEITDLTAALKKAKTSAPEIERICEAHRAERDKLQKFVDDHDRWKNSGEYDFNTDRHSSPVGDEPKFPDVKFTPGLPEEFVDYFDGACAWRKGETDKARAAWERLLSRPPAERKFKSTWAAYMLGKCWMDDDPDKAREFFQKTRDLARTGFSDTVGLATASLGLEARLNLDQKKFEPTIELYLEQLAAEDYSAVQSLRVTASHALEENDPDGALLVPLAKNSKTQRVLTAYVLSQNQGDSANTFPAGDTTDSLSLRWLRSVETAAVSDVESAEKLALAAYQDGSFAEAARWIKRAAGSPLARWLQAKLLMREGKTSQAAGLLAGLCNVFPVEDRGTNEPQSFTDNLYVPFSDVNRGLHGLGAQILGEYGTLQLARQQYADSLHALLHSCFWQDAAYVAERVMTLDEIKGYVDRYWPAPKVDTNDPTANDTPAELSPRWIAENIRYLLARRLTRSQRGSEARGYYPAVWQPKFDELATALNDGWNETFPSAQRAKALLSAAIIARTNGMELTGTELGPDWFVHGGNFEVGVTADLRTNETFRILPATTNELRRAFAHNTDPDARFHYRYQAAFLAWRAAGLMPNNSDDTARALCVAGSWLKDRDPETADLFYKSLVRRCRKTAIGAEADRIRWFPEFDAQGNLIPRVPPVANLEPVIVGTEEAPEAETDAPEVLVDGENSIVPDDLTPEEELPSFEAEYEVQAGDSLASIASAYGINAEDLLEANPDLEARRLRVGQKLFIPAAH